MIYVRDAIFRPTDNFLSLAVRSYLLQTGYSFASLHSLTAAIYHCLVAVPKVESYFYTCSTVYIVCTTYDT